MRLHPANPHIADASSRAEGAESSVRSVRGAFSKAEFRSLVEEWSREELQSEVLRRRSDDDRNVSRVHLRDGRTVVLKLWKRPGLKGALRRVTRTASVFWEWRCLRRLERAAVSVPRALAYGVLRSTSTQYTEALAMEDLGPLVNAMDHVSGLVAAEDERGLRAIEDDLCRLTRSLLGAGVVDSDHSLMNMALDGNGKLVRLDFELARPVPSPRLAPTRYGIMLGRLIASYEFAVHPHDGRARRFAYRLADELKPGAGVLGRAHAYVARALQRQLERTGVVSSLKLEW
jgi:hypothetical protein